MSRREKPASLAEVIYDTADAIRMLAQDTEIGLDLETSGLSPWHDKIAVVSLYGEQSGTTCILHIRGRMTPELRTFLSRHEALWVGHNVFQFDMLFLAMAGVDIYYGRYYDTMIGEQVTLVSGRRDVRSRLQDAVARRLGVHLKKDQGESAWMAEELSTEQLEYCVSDIFYLPKLYRAQLEKVAGTRQAEAMDFEQRLGPLVAKMSLNGLPLDIGALEKWRRDQVIKEVEARKTINLCFGPEMNIGSPKQIKSYYLAIYDIDMESTDVEHLTALSEMEGEPGEVAAALLTARRARKRTGMYTDAWVADHSWNGRVHARFWQCATDTFRFSSSNPNLQQIPRDGRHIFGGLLGHSIVSVDFSQLEVRVAAAIAQDQELLSALDTEDIHTTVATNIYHIPYAEITKDQRRNAKAAVFTLLFGGSASGLVRYAKMLGGKLEYEEAKGIVRTFFNTYQGISMARSMAIARAKQGTVVQLTLPNGARRVLAPETNDYGPPQVRPSQILNTMVQGSAAIGMKYAIFQAHEDGLSKYLGSVVHDELVATVPTGEAEDYAVALSDAMQKGMAKVLGTVKVGTEFKVNTHWS